VYDKAKRKAIFFQKNIITNIQFTVNLTRLNIFIKGKQKKIQQKSGANTREVKLQPTI
jgi:hypothetical protein